MDDPRRDGEPAIRNISDTALWAALHRARESERPDALFRDPMARRLAGERGEQIGRAVARGDKFDWPWVMRTLLFDEFIAREIEQRPDGVDMVINLAAGLDARPYRMNLPPSLQWIEVDLPALLDEKEKALAGHKPRCRLERVRLDLADAGARRTLFEQIGRRARKAMILTEGLLIYLSEEEVGALAQDLARQPSFGRWVIDLGSPGLLRILQQRMRDPLSQSGASFKFGPAEGPPFFERYGWKPLEVRSLLKEAAKRKRLSLFLRLLAKLPDSQGKQGRRPWGGVCSLGRADV